MKKTKSIISVILALCIAFAFAGCHFDTTKSYKYTVETGEDVCVTLDTTGGYDVTSDLPFTVYDENGTAISEGSFAYGSTYYDYVNIVDSEEESVLLDSGLKDGGQYIFWTYDYSEYNYAILLDGGNTAVILHNVTSEDSAKDIFNRLNFEVL